MSITQAALGATVTVPTADGEETIEVKPGTQPGTEIRLRGKGVPHLRRSGARGDLHVLVDVKIPTKLTKRQRELLAEFAAETGEAGNGQARQGPHRQGQGRDQLSDTWLELSVSADRRRSRRSLRSSRGSRPAA